MNPSQSDGGPPTLDARALLDLKPGWDTYDGAPISAEAVRTAGHICAVPLSNGGIQIEMHAGGIALEIEIAPNGRVIDLDWEAA